MEFSKVFVAKPEFKDLHKGFTTQHFHAEVALLDKSLSGLTPQVYQLKSQYLSQFLDSEHLRRGFGLGTIDQQAFAFVGDFREIDTSKKIIRLTSSNIMSYKYLIVFTSNNHPLELATALHTLKDALLLDALNIKQKIHPTQNPFSPFNLMTPNRSATHYFSIQSQEQEGSKQVEKVAAPLLPLQGGDYSIKEIAPSPKTLCQVQL